MCAKWNNSSFSSFSSGGRGVGVRRLMEGSGRVSVTHTAQFKWGCPYSRVMPRRMGTKSVGSSGKLVHGGHCPGMGGCIMVVKGPPHPPAPPVLSLGKYLIYSLRG